MFVCEFEAVAPASVRGINGRFRDRISWAFNILSCVFCAAPICEGIRQRHLDFNYTMFSQGNVTQDTKEREPV